jgi:hypothetical protein
MATTDDRQKNISAESAGTLKLDTGIPIGNGHMGIEGAVEEPKDDIGQNDIPPSERTAIVRDVARRTGVESGPNSVARNYAACEIDFRGHHQANAGRRRGSYEIYRVIYRYGYDLGADPRYRTVEWTTVEQDARPRWEERNPGTWEEFKDTIRYAWDTARK